MIRDSHSAIFAIFFTLRLAVLATKSFCKLVKGKDAFHQAHGWTKAPRRDPMTKCKHNLVLPRSTQSNLSYAFLF